MANGVEGNGEGNEEPPTRPKRVKPYRGRMRGPRIHENGITGPGVVLATVALDDGDVGQVAQILAGPGGQVWIELDGRDPAGGTDEASATIAV